MYEPPGREMLTEDKENLTFQWYVCWRIPGASSSRPRRRRRRRRSTAAARHSRGHREVRPPVPAIRGHDAGRRAASGGADPSRDRCGNRPHEAGPAGLADARRSPAGGDRPARDPVDSQRRRRAVRDRGRGRALEAIQLPGGRQAGRVRRDPQRARAGGDPVPRRRAPARRARSKAWPICSASSCWPRPAARRLASAATARPRRSRSSTRRTARTRPFTSCSRRWRPTARSWTIRPRSCCPPTVPVLKLLTRGLPDLPGHRRRRRPPVPPLPSRVSELVRGTEPMHRSNGDQFRHCQVGWVESSRPTNARIKW